jgi:hypothetical protein
VVLGVEDLTQAPLACSSACWLAAVLALTVLSCVFCRVCATHAEGTNEWHDCTRLVRYRWWRAPRTPMLVAPEKKQMAEPPLPLP